MIEKESPHQRPNENQTPLPDSEENDQVFWLVCDSSADFGVTSAVRSLSHSIVLSHAIASESMFCEIARLDSDYWGESKKSLVVHFVRLVMSDSFSLHLHFWSGQRKQKLPFTPHSHFHAIRLRSPDPCSFFWRQHTSEPQFTWPQSNSMLAAFYSHHFCRLNPLLFRLRLLLSSTFSFFLLLCCYALFGRSSFATFSCLHSPFFFLSATFTFHRPTRSILIWSTMLAQFTARVDRLATNLQSSSSKAVDHKLMYFGIILYGR